MLKKTITYTDYDGNTQTEDFYFNLTKAELAEMELSTEGGMENMLKEVVDSKDNRRILEVFKDIVRRAYGVKTDDGKRFVKTESDWLAFTQTEAYSELFMELIGNADAAAAFINGVVPKIEGEQQAQISMAKQKMLERHGDKNMQ